MEHVVNFFFFISCFLAWSLTKGGLQKEEDESEWIAEITKPIFKKKLLKGVLLISWFIFFSLGFYYFVRFIYYGITGVFEQMKSEATNNIEFWLICISVVIFTSTLTSRFKIKK